MLTRLVTGVARQSPLPRPAPVAVHDDRNVGRNALGVAGHAADPPLALLEAVILAAYR
jgi:hypothetical protein